MNFKLPSYIVPYFKRKRFCRKVRDTEKEIQSLKANKKWKEASRLKYILRNGWWGYKRYSNEQLQN